jgi:hypothetical protein
MDFQERDSTYLGEGQRVKLVLGGNLKTRGLAVLDVVGGLGADLDGGVDLLVVRGGNDGQVLGADEGSGEGSGLVAETERVAGDGGLLDVVTSLTTDEEALVAGGHVKDGVEVAVGKTVVDEGARVHVGAALLGLLGFQRFWRSTLTPVEATLASSTLVSRREAVVQAWVTVTSARGRQVRMSLVRNVELCGAVTMDM